MKKETDHYGVASDALDKNLNESVSQVGSSDTTAATAFDTSAENDDMPAVIKRESVLLSTALIKENNRDGEKYLLRCKSIRNPRNAEGKRAHLLFQRMEANFIPLIFNGQTFSSQKQHSAWC